MGKYHVVIETPSYARYEVVADSEDEAIDMAWDGADKKLVEGWIGEDRESQYHSIEQLPE